MLRRFVDGPPASGGPRVIFGRLVGRDWSCMVVSRSTAERPAAARAYVEADRSRVDDYYLAEGSGLARRFGASPGDGVIGSRGAGRRRVRAVGRRPRPGDRAGAGSAAARTATRCGSSRSRSTARRPGRWPPRWTRGRGGVRRRAGPGRRADHRLGRRARHHPGRAAGRQVQVPVEQIEAVDGAALHLPRRGPAPPPAPAGQRPGVRRRAVAGPAHGRVPRLHRGAQRHRARRGDVRPGVPGRPRRAPGSPSTRRPGRSPSWRRTWGRSASGPRRSAATSTGTRPNGAPRTPARSPARRCGGRGTGGPGRTPAPTRSSPNDGAELVAAWNQQLRDLGYRDPTPQPGLPIVVGAPRVGEFDRDAAVETILVRLGARRSAWNAADIRGAGREGDRRGRARRRPGRAHRAGRGPHRPRRSRRACRCWTSRMCPSTSGP